MPTRIAGQEDGIFTEVGVLKNGALSAGDRLARPLKVTGSKAVAAGATDTITLTVPTQERWIVKEIAIPAVTGVTVNSITTDSVGTGQTATFDTASVFGEKLVLGGTIVVSVTNGGAASATVSVNVTGVSIS